MNRTLAISIFAVLGLATIAVIILAIASYTPPSASSRPHPAAAVPATEIKPTTDVAPEVMASIEADAGIPPLPNADTTAGYVAALDAINPDIVHGKTDTAVTRGRNQCSSVKSTPNDRAKLVELTNKRFSSPDHPNGFGSTVASQILDIVRKYLCP